MNTKRLAFWCSFLLILGLIVWGLAVAMNKPAGSISLGAPAPVTTTDQVKGPLEAPVTLIMYEDFQCPACAAYMPLIEKLFLGSSTTLRVVYRHFPLPQHTNAFIAAQASEAAAVQGKFWEMYRLIYAGQTDWSDIPLKEARTILDGYAQSLGIDMTKFGTDIDNPDIKKKIQAQLTEGQALGINATPTFFVNGEAITNPQSYEQFKALIDAAAR